MGLDNIPKNYACRKNGTAVMVKMMDHRTGEPYIDQNGDTVDQIDCDATVTAGGCPWHRRLGNQDGGVLGPLGTYCWYRGKYGVQLLAKVGIDGMALYGDEDEFVSADTCHGLADDIDDHIETTRASMPDVQHEVDLVYLRDWLRFVADECDGADAWA